MTARVLAFVEGQTEEKFIRATVASTLITRNVSITATTPGRKRSQGGVRPWAGIRKELLRYLKEDGMRYVTTMFDYYGMPTDWPGRKKSVGLQKNNEKAYAIENAMLEDISEVMGNTFDRGRFIPYIQMYEFEALLFSAPDILGKVTSEQDITHDLQSIADGFRTPEEINDNPHSAPSKRILLLSRQYQKPLHGNIAAQKIGLSLMRKKCPHFGEWLATLESLGEES